MIDALTAILMTEASAATPGLNPLKRDQILATHYENIMKTEGISYQEFETTFNYYLQQPDSLSALLQEVENKLTMLDSKVTANKSRNQKTDSASVKAP